MNWMDKAQALNSIGRLSLHLSQVIEGGWMASVERIEIGGNGFLHSPSCHGVTPEAAIDQLWQDLTDLKPDQYLVRNAFLGERHHYRWNGFMWDSLPVEQKQAVGGE